MPDLQAHPVFVRGLTESSVALLRSVDAPRTHRGRTVTMAYILLLLCEP